MGQLPRVPTRLGAKIDLATYFARQKFVNLAPGAKMDATTFFGCQTFFIDLAQVPTMGYQLVPRHPPLSTRHCLACLLIVFLNILGFMECDPNVNWPCLSTIPSFLNDLGLKAH